MADKKVIIVTGASRGIGYAISRYLLTNTQAKLIVTARSTGSLEDLKSRHSESQMEIVPGDVSTDVHLPEKLVGTAVQKWGRLDGVVLNHGTLGEVKRVVDGDLDAWRKTFELQHAIPELRKTKGRIVLTSSGAAVSAYSTWGAYGATKAALNHLTLTLKAEEPDITTVSIRPGIVDSDMQKEIREVHHDRMDEKDRNRFKSAHTEGKLLKPEQPGNVIARLVMGAGEELGGQFLSWNDEKLKEFQD